MRCSSRFQVYFRIRVTRLSVRICFHWADTPAALVHLGEVQQTWAPSGINTLSAPILFLEGQNASTSVSADGAHKAWWSSTIRPIHSLGKVRRATLSPGLQWTLVPFFTRVVQQHSTLMVRLLPSSGRCQRRSAEILFCARHEKDLEPTDASVKWNLSQLANMQQ